MRKILLTTALALIALMSCEPLEQVCTGLEESPEARVSVSVKASQATKSSMAVSETSVSNLNVYAYRNGMLEVESYATQDEAELVLVLGARYTIYALANCGEVHAPAQEGDLTSVSLAPSDMIMCLREGREVTAGSSGSTLEIQLTRLFARYVLRLDKNLENCNYRITSVQVKQRAAAVQPFASASAAASTADGDSASAADLVALNEGEGAVFYVPENCQGVLLPGNTDPWAKVPANIPVVKRGLCTYLHIVGVWTTGGASADLSFNLMLGADNCTDFNVVRNTSVNITLSVGDSGTCRTGWKVSMDNLEDDRILSFDSSAYQVMQGDGWTQIPLTVSPLNMVYSASLSGPETPVLEAKVENGKVYVRGIYDGELKPQSTLTVTSWDGRVSASTFVTLSYNYAEFRNYTYSKAVYTGQYGYIQFTNASGTDPVVVETPVWSTTMAGPRSSGADVEYYYDSTRRIEYYVNHSLGRVYLRPLVKGVSSSYIQMTQHKTRVRLYIAPAYNPGLAISNAEVSEAGNRYYDQDHSLYYDSTSMICLLDNNGEKLDPGIFMIPSDLLDFRDLTASFQDRFGDFVALYGVPEVQSSQQYGFVKETLMRGNCAEMAATGNLAKLFVYGTTDYGTSNPTYPITASLALQNGDVITGSGRLTGKPAFPSQRYLGSYYNYQVAPGALRSYATQVDFTSGGVYDAPSPNGVTWDIVHIDGTACDNPSSAYSAGSADIYTANAGLSGWALSFEPLSTGEYPSCGAIGLRGTVTNPHSGRVYTGYYTMSLVLYCSVGCSVFFSGRLAVNFRPFCEYVNQDRTVWTNCFPAGIKVTSEYNTRDYRIFGTTPISEATLYITGVGSPGSVDEAVDILSEDLSRYRYSFHMGGSYYDDLLLDRSAASLSENGGWNVDGSKGYYHLVRQYDLENLDYGDKYNGLENYILEAALETLGNAGLTL